MSPLSPQSRDLIDAARDGDALDEGDRRRLESAILTQVAAGAAMATAATAEAAKVAGAGKAAGETVATTGTVAAATGGGAVTLTKIGAGLALVGALGLGARQIYDDSTPSPPAPTASAAVAAAPPSTASSDAAGLPDLASETESEPSAEELSDEAASDEDVPAQVQSAPAGPAPAASAPPREPRRSLAEETALLQRAQAEIQAGNSEAALDLLEEHEAGYAEGAMAEEREAARVLALCGAGRAAEARVAAASFLARHPRSPHRARVAAACAAE